MPFASDLDDLDLDSHLFLNFSSPPMSKYCTYRLQSDRNESQTQKKVN